MALRIMSGAMLRQQEVMARSIAQYSTVILRQHYQEANLYLKEAAQCAYTLLVTHTICSCVK